MDKYYHIRYDKYTFLAKKHTDRRARLTTFTIGGKRKDCMQFLMYHGEPYAILQGVTKGSECAMDTPLEDGIGTRKMIEAGLNAVFQLFPKISEIQLTDTAMMDCENGRRIILSTMYAVRYGTTYYGHYFRAAPKVADTQRKLDTLHTTFSESPIPHSFSKDIWPWIAKQLPPNMTEKILDHKRAYHQTYKESSNLHDFFHRLNAQGCGKLNFWIDRYVQHHFELQLLHTDWVIYRKTQHPIEINEIEKPVQEPKYVEPNTHRRLFSGGYDQIL